MNKELLPFAATGISLLLVGVLIVWANVCGGSVDAESKMIAFLAATGVAALIAIIFITAAALRVYGKD